MNNREEKREEKRREEKRRKNIISTGVVDCRLPRINMKCLSEVDAGRNLYLQDAITSEMLISKFNISLFLNYFNILIIIIIKNLIKKILKC